MNMKNLELFDISVEEFDKMNSKHTFSKEYNQKKKALMKEYRKSLYAPNMNRYAKVAVACALVLVANPLIANAATNGELFSRIWGTLTRSDVKSHDEVVYDEEKGTSYTVTYPERDYEEVDVQKADELIGKEMSYPSITKDIDGTTLTILSAVRDHNAAVVEFTLEKDGGVDALNYSQLDNEANGAWFSDASTFWFKIGDGGENIFVDLKKSTDDKLYCYDYMTLDSAKGSLMMEIQEYPCTRGEYIADDDEIASKITKSTISIPLADNVNSVKYINDNGGSVEISPLSIKIDMENGLGLSKEEAYDPWNCYYVSVNYKDGTNYVVREHEKSGKHTCDVEIDNSSYGCSSLDNQLTYVFNRLVDVDEVSSITINDVEYTCK